MWSLIVNAIAPGASPATTIPTRSPPVPLESGVSARAFGRLRAVVHVSSHSSSFVLQACRLQSMRKPARASRNRLPFKFGSGLSVYVWTCSAVSPHNNPSEFLVLGRPCRRNQFLDRISNSILGSSTRASFAGRQQVASSFSQTRIAMMVETGEMVGASFLSICVTVGAASFGPPKARNLLSSALPFNVVAPLFFWWVWRQLAAHPGAHSKTPNHMAQQRGAHLEPTLYCMEELRGTHTEPTRNPPGTQQDPAWQSERNPRGAHESPPGTDQEPTPNRI